MGFPLSTDIFGQLAWLVNQVKLLVFRVTRIEQGGGGGAQNINQVLTTGNTATNKEINLISTLSPGATYTGIFHPAYTQYTETLTDSTSVSGFFGRSQLIFNNSVDASTLSIGRSEGYLGGLGFTITNGAGSSVSCDTTQYVVKSDAATNKLTATGISVVSPDASKNVGLSFNPIDRTINTIVDDANYGFFFDQPNGTCIIGASAADYFGVDTTNHRLMISPSLYQSGSYSSPAGFVEISVNGTQYWIELWN